mmetsp:Transcript_100430/g.176936  ORF Transcript_100430/g.176936 Transcript_100430/m.176936 type:complete len:833 (-) Transcript_100430:71-2569(-)
MTERMTELERLEELEEQMVMEASEQQGPQQSTDPPPTTTYEEFLAANFPHKAEEEKKRMAASSSAASPSRASMSRTEYAQTLRHRSGRPGEHVQTKQQRSVQEENNALRASVEATRVGSVRRSLADHQRAAPGPAPQPSAEATRDASISQVMADNRMAKHTPAPPGLRALEEAGTGPPASTSFPASDPHLGAAAAADATAAVASPVSAAPRAEEDTAAEVKADEAGEDVDSGASRFSLLRQRGLEARKAALAAAAAATSSANGEPQAEEEFVEEDEVEEVSEEDDDELPATGQLSEWRRPRRQVWSSSLDPHQQMPVDPTLWKAWMQELLEEQLARGSPSACESPVRRLDGPDAPPQRRSRPSSAPALTCAARAARRQSQMALSQPSRPASAGGQTLTSSSTSSPAKTPVMPTSDGRTQSTDSPGAFSAKADGNPAKSIPRQSVARPRSQSAPKTASRTTSSPAKRRGPRLQRPQSAPRLLDGRGLLEKRAHRDPFLQHMEDRAVQRSKSRLRHESCVEKERREDTVMQDLRLKHNFLERAKTKNSTRPVGKKRAQRPRSVHRIGPSHEAWKELRPVDQMRNLCHVMDIDVKLTTNRLNCNPRVTRGASMAPHVLQRAGEEGHQRRATQSFARSLNDAFKELNNDDLRTRRRRASMLTHNRENPEIAKITLKILEFILDRCGTVRAFFRLLMKRHGRIRRRDWETAFMALGYVSDEPSRLFRSMDAEGRHELPTEDLQDAIELQYGALVQNKIEVEARRRTIVEPPVQEVEPPMQEAFAAEANATGAGSKMASPEDSLSRRPSTHSESDRSETFTGLVGDFTPQVSGGHVVG